MYTEDLALNSQQWLICHKTKHNDCLYICLLLFFAVDWDFVNVDEGFIKNILLH